MVSFPEESSISHFNEDIASQGSWESSLQGSEHASQLANRNGEKERQEIEDLARKETASVRRWRLIVVSLLAAMGGLLSTFTYRILRDKETEDYKDAVSCVPGAMNFTGILLTLTLTRAPAKHQFSLFSSTVSEITTSRVMNIYEAVNGMSETISAFANTSPSSFPEFRLPNFEVTASQHRARAGLMDISFAPFILQHERQGWESYSWENQDWIQESRLFSSNDKKGGSHIQGTDYVDRNISAFIYDEFSVHDREMMTTPSPEHQVSGKKLRDSSVKSEKSKSGTCCTEVCSAVVYQSSSVQSEGD